MIDMPERIWMKPDDFLRTGTTAKDAAEYIRADLHAAEVERLREALGGLMDPEYLDALTRSDDASGSVVYCAQRDAEEALAQHEASKEASDDQ